jgi:outer membrane protein assembly factor BamB
VALAATIGGTWLAASLADAAIRWQGAIENHSFLASPAWSAKHVLLYSREGALVCLDPAQGGQRWRRDLPNGGEASPLIIGDQAVVADGDGMVHLVALENGVERWRYTTGATITASPAMADGRLLIAASDGALYCFTGKKP